MLYTYIYPPTPADARGSAPGNNTFDPFFERKEQEQQDEKGAKIIIFYGFQKLHLAFLRCSFGVFPSFTAMGICRWEWFAFRRRS
jgi:hypothetical protein